MSGNIYSSLNRVRKPRVHISLDIETNGAEPLKELPFVVGVMGDFSGDPTAVVADDKDPSGRKLQPVALAPLDQRKFVQINRDNFDKVMESMTPGLKLEVANTLAKEEGEMMKVELAFQSMDDFDPGRVAEQVPALKALLEARNKLRDLMVKADRSEQLGQLLEEVLRNQDQLKALSSDLDNKKG